MFDLTMLQVYFSRRVARAKRMYEDFISSKDYPFLKEKEQKIIINQLKRHMCIQEAYFINEQNGISDACSDYELGSVYKNYTDTTPCIGNWPGFLMNKMPYWERELKPILNY